MFNKYFGPKRLADYEAAKAVFEDDYPAHGDLVGMVGAALDDFIQLIERLRKRADKRERERDEALARLAEIAAMETPGAAHAAKRMAAVAREALGPAPTPISSAELIAKLNDPRIAGAVNEHGSGRHA